ncbi:MAG: hypothetical protein QM756_39100 [Polyangiaceae bacterium]
MSWPKLEKLLGDATEPPAPSGGDTPALALARIPICSLPDLVTTLITPSMACEP